VAPPGGPPAADPQPAPARKKQGRRGETPRIPWPIWAVIFLLFVAAGVNMARQQLGFGRA
jgi:hypothetical protein